MSSSAQTTVKSSQELLNVAGNLVDKFLKDDHTFYDLSGLLGIATDSMCYLYLTPAFLCQCYFIERANVSGNLDSAYPALNSSLPALAGMPFLGDIDHTPLPQELLQEFESKRIEITDDTVYCMQYVFID